MGKDKNINFSKITFVNESETGHCCFKFSGLGASGDSIFECIDVDEGMQIFNALKSNAALTETLRLKELENQQLAQDKAELVEALTGIHGEAVSYQNRTGNPVTWCLKIGKLLEKHK